MVEFKKKSSIILGGGGGSGGDDGYGGGGGNDGGGDLFSLDFLLVSMMVGLVSRGFWKVLDAMVVGF